MVLTSTRGAGILATMTDPTSPSEPAGKRIPLPPIVETALSVMAAIGVILSAMSTFIDKLKPFREMVPDAWRWAVPVVLAAVALWLGVRAHRGFSALRTHPAEVLDQILAREDLKGRNTEVDFLLRACQEKSLVCLVGESGVGKSTLVRAGLKNALREQADFLLVHVENLGWDWDAGPREALRQAILRALSQEERGRLELEHPRSTEFDELVLAIRAKLSRTVLVVLDQLDEYFAQHREKFVQQGRVLGAAQLKTSSKFWRDFAALLEKGYLRCVLVTRSDPPLVLEPFRLVDWTCLNPLLKLRKDDAKAAADVLFGVKADVQEKASSPHWEMLKDRVLRDLAEAGGGAVLPAQMRIALKGLSNLPNLTLEGYEKAGGLLALERRYVEDEIEHARSAVRIDAPTALAIVGEMVEALSSQQSKAFPRTVDEIWQAMGARASGDRPSRETITTLLQRLKDAHIVRSLPDEEVLRWTLYHDYVARPIQEARRHLRRHQARLEEGDKNLRAAAGFWVRWEAMLSPREQARILWARLRSIFGDEGFRYGAMRAYALWSLVRLTPYLFGLAVASVGVGLYVKARLEIRRAEEVQALVERQSFDRSTFSLRHRPSPDALWDLAEADESTQLAFFDRLTGSSELARRMRPGLRSLAHSVVGTDPARRARLEEHLVRRCVRPLQAEEDIVHTCAVLLEFLESRRPEAIRFLIGAGLEVELYRDHFAALDSLGAFQALTPEERAGFVTHAIEQLEKARSDDVVNQIVATIARIPQEPSEAQLAKILALVEAWEAPVKAYQIKSCAGRHILAARFRSDALDRSLLNIEQNQMATYLQFRPFLTVHEWFPKETEALLDRLVEHTCTLRDVDKQANAGAVLYSAVAAIERSKDVTLLEQRRRLDGCVAWMPHGQDAYEAMVVDPMRDQRRARIQKKCGDKLGQAFDTMGLIESARTDVTRWLQCPNPRLRAQKISSILIHGFSDRPELAAEVLVSLQSERQRFRTLALDSSIPEQRWLGSVMEVAGWRNRHTLQETIDAAVAGVAVSHEEIQLFGDETPTRRPTREELDKAVDRFAKSPASWVPSMAVLLRYSDATDRAHTVKRLVGIAADAQVSSKMACLIQDVIGEAVPPTEKLPIAPAALNAFTNALNLVVSGDCVRSLRTFASMVSEEKRQDVVRLLLTKLSEGWDETPSMWMRDALRLFPDLLIREDIVALLSRPDCIDDCRDELSQVLRGRLGSAAPDKGEGFWALMEFAAGAGVRVDGRPTRPTVRSASEKTSE